MSHRLTITVQPEVYAICKLKPAAKVPDWAADENFCCVTRTESELSIVCPEQQLPRGTKAERDWRLLRVEGKLSFSLTGVLASITSPLGDAQISVFAISTYDTDYVLVRDAELNRAIQALEIAGHTVREAYE